jgi:hypothetical protein
MKKGWSRVTNPRFLHAFALFCYGIYSTSDWAEQGFTDSVFERKLLPGFLQSHTRYGSGCMFHVMVLN